MTADPLSFQTQKLWPSVVVLVCAAVVVVGTLALASSIALAIFGFLDG